MAQSITFQADRKVDRVLVQKLNAVAPFMYDDPTGAARKLLHQKLDEFIEEHSITVDYSQPAGVAG